MLIRLVKLSILGATGLLIACSGYENQSTTSQPSAKAAASEDSPVSVNNIDQILASQEETAQARYQYRHPKETLEFIGIKPGMTVVEALPGGGWYSKILLPFLGADGSLVGVDYSMDMWQHFGGFATAEFIEDKKTWVSTWTAQAQDWRGEDSASVSAFQFGNMPEAMQGSADAVLFIRALHNLSRFQDKGPYLDDAISETYSILKPGGIVGVVQHQAREDRPDAWADGSNGYLKKSALVEKFTAQGFELIADSAINSNEKDLADEGDFVWRLPPSLSGSKDDPEKRAAMSAIGESNRMTLKFRKPS